MVILGYIQQDMISYRCVPPPIASIAYPPRRHSPQDLCFDDQFQGHDRSIPSAHLRYVNHEEVPLKAHRNSSQSGTQRHQQEIAKTMVMSVLITHPYKVEVPSLSSKRKW